MEALDTRPGPASQSAEGVTYAEKVEGHERRLDPARPAVELERTVRALNPHIGTWVDGGSDDRLGVRRARVAEGVAARKGLLCAEGGTLLMGTSSGALELLEVQPPGKRAMAASDYLRGRVRSASHNQRRD
ncbi:MAG: hypothetical protein ACR2J6_05905 [Thermoleophilaceae bacterium]